MMTTEEAVREHLRAMVERDLDAFLDGYADDAVILAGPEPVVGKAAIGGLFEMALATLPADMKPPDDIVFHGEYAFVRYQIAGMRGADTFRVHDGKITMQTAHIVVDPPS